MTLNLDFVTFLQDFPCRKTSSSFRQHYLKWLVLEKSVNFSEGLFVLAPDFPQCKLNQTCIALI